MSQGFTSPFDFSAAALTGTILAPNVVISSLTAVGALDSGSIVAGFSGIDGTPIGAGTPDAGDFTDLAASGALAVAGTSMLSGDVTVGPGTGNVSLVIDGGAGSVRDIRFQTGGVNRWILRGANNATESGSNAGSNFEIIPRADDGSTLGVAVTITRATGAVALAGTLAVAGVSVLTGNVGIGAASGANALTVTETGALNPVVYLNASHATTPLGMLIDFSGGSPNDRTHYFLRMDDAGGPEITFWSDGGADFTGDVTTTGNLTALGTGPHAVGGPVVAGIGLSLTPTLTLPNASTFAAIFDNLGASITTQNNSENLGDVASFIFREPDITIGTDTIFRASTVLITGAPTEGNQNDALRIAQGSASLLGDVGIGALASPTAFGLFGPPTTSKASARLPHGSAPTSPVDGDMWTTTAGLFVRINGSTVGPLS